MPESARRRTASTGASTAGLMHRRFAGRGIARRNASPGRMYAEPALDNAARSPEKRFPKSNCPAVGHWTPEHCATRSQRDVADAEA